MITKPIIYSDSVPFKSVDPLEAQNLQGIFLCRNNTQSFYSSFRQFSFFVFLLLTFAVTNCSTTKKITNFSNTSTPVGKPKYYQTTSNLAVHFFFGIVPIHETLGNSSFEKTLEDFTADAVKNENNKIHIIHRETVRYWYVLFPITAVFTPVTTEITGFVQE